MCEQCGTPITLGFIFCTPCLKVRQNAAKRAWRQRNWTYQRSLERSAKRRRRATFCAIVVHTCEGCSALFIRRGKSRAKFCPPCSVFYEREGNNERSRRKYWRHKELRRAA